MPNAIVIGTTVTTPDSKPYRLFVDGEDILTGTTSGPGGEPTYPTPWASSAATSFLATAAATRADLEAAGFALVSFRDATADLRAAQIANRNHIEREGLPALGPHVFMGPAFRDYQLNTARSTMEGRLGAIEALVRKP